MTSFLFFVATISLIIQLLYWIYFRRSLKTPKPILDITVSEPVSIIICAHNEFINLKKNLPSILSQDYPNFEVCIVLDNNTDNSMEYLKSVDDSRLKIFTINNTSAGKKQALTFGIKNAQYPTVLLTDADCQPESNLWIRSMMSARPSSEVVLGYGPIVSKNKSLITDFVNYETIQSAMLYLTAADNHMPYMAVGRNLLYDKSVFEEIGGFESHLDLASGDDDLFMQSLTEDVAISINSTPVSYMNSAPPDSLIGFRNQKQRHLSTGVKYNWKSQLYLGSYIASGICIWLSSFLILNFWILLLKFILMYLILYKIMVRMRLQATGVRWIWLDLLFYFYWMMTPFLYYTAKTNKWK